jgi:hypothetical protein
MVRFSLISVYLFVALLMLLPIETDLVRDNVTNVWTSTTSTVDEWGVLFGRQQEDVFLRGTRA